MRSRQRANGSSDKWQKKSLITIGAIALAGAVTMGGCGESSAQSEGLSDSSPQEQSQGTDETINPATLEALKSFSVADAEKQAGVTVPEIAEYVKDPTDTEFGRYLQTEEIYVFPSERPPEGVTCPLAYEALKITQGQSNPQELQQYLWDKGLTNDRLLEVNQLYESITPQINYYQSQANLNEVDKYYARFTDYGRVLSALLAEMVVSGKIKLLNEPGETIDPRVENMVDSWYGGEEQMRKLGLDSPVGKILIITPGEDGNLSFEKPYSEKVFVFNPWISKNTVLTIDGDPNAGYQAYVARQRSNNPEIYDEVLQIANPENQFE